MALKDRFEKMISYFDSDDDETVQDKVVIPEPVTEQIERREQVSVKPQSDRPRPIKTEAVKSEPIRPIKPSRHYAERYQPSQDEQREAEQTRIALKFPRKYEDAQEIVDLLIENECVLIDFQYMLDAQARRCLDFIDGASRVLYGNLQKVGSSMYLLTPGNVVVDVDAINGQSGREVSFDYDMKRR